MAARKRTKKTKIRQIQFNDSNLFPIVEWDPHESQFKLQAVSAHSYFVKRGVYRYCEKLAQMWNERELAITINTVKPVKDEDNLHRDVESVDDDEENVEDDEEPDDEYNEINVNIDDNATVNKHLSPPFQIHYDPELMKSLIKELRDEIQEIQHHY